MGIYILEMDLNNKYNINIDHIRKKIPIVSITNISLIWCSFSFHYFMNNIRQLENIILFINNIIAINGFVIILTYNCKKIFNLLKDNKNHYKIYKNERLKYSIKSLYKNTNKILSN